MDKCSLKGKAETPPFKINIRFSTNKFETEIPTKKKKREKTKVILL